MAIEVDANGAVVMDGNNPKALTDGAYKSGDEMMIAANMSETVLKGSAITATLDTGAKIRLVLTPIRIIWLALYCIFGRA